MIQSFLNLVLEALQSSYTVDFMGFILVFCGLFVILKKLL